MKTSGCFSLCSRRLAIRDARALSIRDQCRAFTLLELLVVMGLVATLSFFLIGGLGHRGKSAALKSAQASMANLITVARTNAMASGQSCRILVNVDPADISEPRRYLRYVVVQVQTVDGWQIVTDTFLPDAIYIVPGNFSSMPVGLFAANATVPWSKADGSDLRSTALRSNQITTEAINSATPGQWVGITLSSIAGTVQSGDLILISGHRRAPGSFAEGEAPIELENPANVRGLTLSSYGVPALINSRTSF
jgi:prepilin-type N-terminal cleavage/methylation domain-containing protein